MERPPLIERKKSNWPIRNLNCILNRPASLSINLSIHEALEK